MALVLAQNEESAADVAYADILGVSYEYPVQYQELIRSGLDFLYYRGKRRSGGVAVPDYFGAGRIGRIDPSSAAGRLKCEIREFRRFETPVPFKQDGLYLEPDANSFSGSNVGLYFRPGVRPISDAVFKRILGLSA